MKKSAIYHVANTMYLLLPDACRTLCRQPSKRTGICDLLDIIINIANVLKARASQYNY